MYPQSTKFSYLLRSNIQVSNVVLQRVIDKAILRKPQCGSSLHSDLQLNPSQPQCFAPDGSVIEAKCAYGNWAMPQLKKDLENEDTVIVRRAIATLNDLILRPERLTEAIKLKVSDSLTNLLMSSDSCLREQVVIIYKTMARQSAGKEVILQNKKILDHLSQGLIEEVVVVRQRMAEVIDILAKSWMAAEDLYDYGFLNIIINQIPFEKEDEILGIELRVLDNLLKRDVKNQAMQIGTMETLKSLLQRKDEAILVTTLDCLSSLCQNSSAKTKFIELDLLPILNNFLNDCRPSILTKSTSTLSFMTITTTGKLLALKLQMIPRLVHLAANRCFSALQLGAIKTLTNLAEAPRGRSILLKHIELIEDIVPSNEAVKKHKEILLDVIKWTP